MGEATGIQWTEATWNPWHGCRKVSAGCKNCYMYRDKARFGQDPSVVVRSKSTFRAPLKWSEPKMIFTCSWSDWFIEDADVWRDEAWDIIRRTPHHTYQILTKRPERIAGHLPADWGDGYPNVWLGVSVENQEAADKRIPLLLDVPAAIRFLSCEPLLGPVTIRGHFETCGDCDPCIGGRPDQCAVGGYFLSALHPEGVHWVIVGGESGPGARPFNLDWARSIIDQCRDAGMPVFVKQLGSRPVGTWGNGNFRPFYAGHWRLGDNKGGDWNEWPEDLRVREMPARCPDA